MSKLSKREFAEEKCGLQTKALSVYISRGKVLVGEDGLIDTDNPVNILFVQERQLKKGMGAQDEPVTVETIVQAVKETTMTAPAKTRVGKVNTLKEKKVREHTHLHEDVREKLGLDRKLKEVEIEKKKRESDLLRSKQDRAAGKLVPTELVKGLFQNHFKAVVVSFSQGIDNMLIEISKRSGLNVNQKAELKGEMKKILNSCIDDAIRTSKRDLVNLIAEYSQTSSTE